MLRAAVRGEEHDYTRASIGRAVLLLAIPMMLEMAMESVFAVVDIFFVASSGADAVAAVGLTEAVLTLLYAVAIGLEHGRDGARRAPHRRRRARTRLPIVAGQTIWLGVATRGRRSACSASRFAPTIFCG